eukprot:g14933.t1
MGKMLESTMEKATQAKVAVAAASASAGARLSSASGKIGSVELPGDGAPGAAYAAGPHAPSDEETGQTRLRRSVAKQWISETEHYVEKLLRGTTYKVEKKLNYVQLKTGGVIEKDDPIWAEIERSIAADLLHAEEQAHSRISELQRGLREFVQLSFKPGLADVPPPTISLTNLPSLITHRLRKTAIDIGQIRDDTENAASSTLEEMAGHFEARLRETVDGPNGKTLLHPLGEFFRTIASTSRDAASYVNAAIDKVAGVLKGEGPKALEFVTGAGKDAFEGVTGATDKVVKGVTGADYKSAKAVLATTSAVGEIANQLMDIMMSATQFLTLQAISESPEYWEFQNRGPRKLRADERILSEMQRLAYNKTRKLTTKSAVAGPSYTDGEPPYGSQMDLTYKAFYLQRGALTPGYEGHMPSEYGHGRDGDPKLQKRCKGNVIPGFQTKCFFPSHGEGQKIGRMPLENDILPKQWTPMEQREHAALCAATMGCAEGCMGCAKKTGVVPGEVDSYATHYLGKVGGDAGAGGAGKGNKNSTTSSTVPVFSNTGNGSGFSSTAVSEFEAGLARQEAAETRRKAVENFLVAEGEKIRKTTEGSLRPRISWEDYRTDYIPNQDGGTRRDPLNDPELAGSTSFRFTNFRTDELPDTIVTTDKDGKIVVQKKDKLIEDILKSAENTTDGGNSVTGGGSAANSVAGAGSVATVESIAGGAGGGSYVDAPPGCAGGGAGSVVNIPPAGSGGGGSTTAGSFTKGTFSNQVSDDDLRSCPRSTLLLTSGDDVVMGGGGPGAANINVNVADPRGDEMMLTHQSFGPKDPTSDTILNQLQQAQPPASSGSMIRPSGSILPPRTSSSSTSAGGGGNVNMRSSLRSSPSMMLRSSMHSNTSRDLLRRSQAGRPSDLINDADVLELRSSGSVLSRVFSGTQEKLLPFFGITSGTSGGGRGGAGGGAKTKLAVVEKDLHTGTTGGAASMWKPGGAPPDRVDGGPAGVVGGTTTATISTAIPMVEVDEHENGLPIAAPTLLASSSSGVPPAGLQQSTKSGNVVTLSLNAVSSQSISGSTEELDSGDYFPGDTFFPSQREDDLRALRARKESWTARWRHSQFGTLTASQKMRKMERERGDAGAPGGGATSSGASSSSGRGAWKRSSFWNPFGSTTLQMPMMKSRSEPGVFRNSNSSAEDDISSNSPATSSRALGAAGSQIRKFFTQHGRSRSVADADPVKMLRDRRQSRDRRTSRFLGHIESDLLNFHKDISKVSRKEALHLDFVVRDDTQEATSENGKKSRLQFVRQLYHVRDPKASLARRIADTYESHSNGTGNMDRVFQRYFQMKKQQQGLDEANAEPRIAMFSVFSNFAIKVSVALFFISCWTIFAPPWFLAFEQFLIERQIPVWFFGVDMFFDVCFAVLVMAGPAAMGDPLQYLHNTDTVQELTSSPLTTGPGSVILVVLQDCYQSRLDFRAKEEIIELAYIQQLAVRSPWFWLALFSSFTGLFVFACKMFLGIDELFGGGVHIETLLLLRLTRLRYLRVMRLCFFVLLWSHLLACLWFYVIYHHGDIRAHFHLNADDLEQMRDTGLLAADGAGAVHSSKNPNFWNVPAIRRTRDQRWEVGSRGSRSIGDAIFMMVAKDRRATTQYESLILGSMGIIGTLNIAVIFGNCNWLFTVQRQRQMKHYQDLEWVKQAVSGLDVPGHLRQRIFDFYNYTQLHYDQEAYDILFRGLSPTLNLELKLYLYADLLRGSAFFNGVKVQVIKSMVLRLVLAIYSAGDYVIHKNDIARECFFIVKGRCEVIVELGMAGRWQRQLGVVL